MKLLVNSESASTNTIEVEVIAKKMGSNATVGQHFAYCIEQAISKLPNGEAAKTAFINAMNECSETAALLKKIPAPAAELFAKCEDAQQLTNYLTNLYRFPSRAGIDAIATKYSAATTATTSAGCAVDKFDSKTAAPIFAMPTIALLPSLKSQPTLPKYRPNIKYSDVKSALDHYDNGKGVFKKMGLANDEKNIGKLREFYNSLRPTPENLNTILDDNQLLSLAEIVSEISDYSQYNDDTSNQCVMPIKNLLGIKRCDCFRSENFSNGRNLVNFINYFHVPDHLAEHILYLNSYIKRFSFILKVLIENSASAENILSILDWLKCRKILTERNAKTVLLLHIDAIDLFIDMANKPVKDYGSSASFSQSIWQNKPETKDVRFQQMLFDTIIKRAAERKLVALFRGLNQKESNIGKVFSSSEIADRKAFKEIANFLKLSPG